MITLPMTGDEVGPELLTAALRASGVLGPTGAVVAVHREPFGAGNGVVADLTLLRPRYANAPDTAPPTIVLKLPAASPDNRAVGEHFGLYTREGHFYAELAAVLPVRTPRAYFSAVEGKVSAILLENLDSWTAGCQVAGASWEQSKRAIDALAPLHAATWDRPLPADAWLDRLDSGVFLSLGEAYRAAWPPFAERFAHVLPPGALELGPRTADAFEDLVRAAVAEAPLAVCHGDYRLDNLLFCGEEVAVLDWQLMHRGPGVEDVALFLTQSLTVELRRRVETDLVRRWHARLGPVADAYPVSQAWAHYRRHALTRTVYTVIVGGTMDTSSERMGVLINAIAVRAFTAALDLDAAQFLR